VGLISAGRPRSSPRADHPAPQPHRNVGPRRCGCKHFVPRSQPAGAWPSGPYPARSRRPVSDP